MKQVFTYLVVIIAIFGLLSIANVAMAQPITGGGNGVGLNNPLGSDSISGVINSIIDGLQTLAAPVVALVVLWGAFQMLFSGGDPEKFAKGKKAITYAIAGYVIILLANGIASIINNVLTGG